jgi:hypothetical protein
MLHILMGLFLGWIFSLIGLDDLFDSLLGFTSEQYYLTWFIIGFVVWIERKFNKRP